tara:strand:+ start:216 stop:377 length:162 start_codon:yes stop_codon:yes gene_type:complete
MQITTNIKNFFKKIKENVFKILLFGGFTFFLVKGLLWIGVFLLAVLGVIGFPE